MRSIYALLLLLVIGCNSNNTYKIETNESFNKIDSIINQSKQNLIAADQANQSSDSSITQKVDKTVKQITTLKTEVKQLKAENNALKTFSLIVLMMLVSLSSYSQYPTTKIIGNDTVVIMTAKQGEDINNQFSALNDSVKSLRNQVFLYKGRSIILSNRINELDSNYKFTKTQFDNMQIAYSADKRLYQQREMMWKKDRRSFSIFAAFSALVATAIVSLGLK